MLFKTRDKLREYAGIGEVNFQSVSKFLRNAEENYLLPVLGPELYDDLTTVYEQAADENTLTGAMKTLLDKCRRVVAPYFVYEWAPRAELLLSDAGLRRQETANSKSAYQYQANNYRESALSEGEKETEKLYAFLEKNREALPCMGYQRCICAVSQLIFSYCYRFCYMLRICQPLPGVLCYS